MHIDEHTLRHETGSREATGAPINYSSEKQSVNPRYRRRTLQHDVMTVILSIVLKTS